MRSSPPLPPPHSPSWLASTDWRDLVDSMHLSRREADILACALLNDRTASMARTLGIAEGTVHTYRDRLFRKLGTSSMSGVLAIAFETFARAHRRV